MLLCTPRCHRKPYTNLPSYIMMKSVFPSPLSLQPGRYHILVCHVAFTLHAVYDINYINVLCASIRNKYILLLYSKYHGNKLHGVRIRFPAVCLKFRTRFLRHCLAGDKSQSLQSPG